MHTTQTQRIESQRDDDIDPARKRTSSGRSVSSQQLSVTNRMLQLTEEVIVRPE